jgi:Na+-translocating ferredoxin:NAD+ oxidoreductase RnfD subunit
VSRAEAAVTAEGARLPRLAIGHRSIPVVLPARGDPRLKLAAIIITLQVLGQTVLGFRVSIAQILVSILLCAAIEVAVTYRRSGMLVWPGSAMLTGNSVAFILRTSGTQHGDWWSLNGIEFFVLACVLSMLSKYLIRPGGAHVFNPSNVGLVWTFLLVGPVHVFPQYLWWGPIGLPVVLALLVILAGAVWILRSVRMYQMAVAFFVPFAAIVAVLALAGRSFYAVWNPNPISGLSYFTNIVLSPEIMVFVFFMMSDPRTAAKTPAGRIAYGVSTAVVAGALISFQSTEFGIKLGILASLTVTCALVPLIDRWAARAAKAREDAPARARYGRAALVAVVIVAVAAPVNTAALANNEEIVLIERGLLGPSSPQ